MITEYALKKLSVIEREYFRDWLMNNFPIYAMAHDIDTIMSTMRDVGAQCKKTEKFLNGIHDHKKWDIEESIYLDEFGSRIDAEDKLKDLSALERVYFRYWLNEEYSGWFYLDEEQMKDADYSIDGLIDALLEIETDYKEISEMLNAIHDHSKWDKDIMKKMDED
ncbi:hypothetical protein AGMMS49944_22160 [Spirochaetia bacterium]|nr:hypothetical protein AGMMS49944_22160 [Spirochaetia bacterium]